MEKAQTSKNVYLMVLKYLTTKENKKKIPNNNKPTDV